MEKTLKKETLEYDILEGSVTLSDTVGNCEFSIIRHQGFHLVVYKLNETVMCGGPLCGKCYSNTSENYDSDLHDA